MATIVVSKTGMVLNQPGIKKNTSSNGEIGETHGVMAHLVKAGHRVVYYGFAKGDLPKGVEFLPADPEGCGFGTPLAAQRKMIANNAKRLAKINGDVFLDMVGPTSSFMAKPDGRTPLHMTVRYVSPVLGAIGTVGLPRVCIKTDIRCYPKEASMNSEWPSLRPIAVMSQETREKKQRVAGWKYDTSEVRCDADGWWIDAGWPRPELLKAQEWDMTLLMHAHIGDGYNNVKRADAFANLLGGLRELAALSKLKARIVGMGWEHFILSNGKPATEAFPNLFLPPVPTADIFNELANSRSCPMITPKEENWHFSAKMLMAAWSGCAPIFYGRGEPFTYDPQGTVVKLDSKMRAAQPGDLVKIVEAFKNKPSVAKALAEHITTSCRPKYEKLDQCLRFVVAGKADVNNDKWFKTFGGFRLVEEGE